MVSLVRRAVQWIASRWQKPDESFEGEIPDEPESLLPQVETFFDLPPERVISNPHSQIPANLVVGAVTNLNGQNR